MSRAEPAVAPRTGLSVAGTLDTVAGHVSPHLVSPAAWRRIRETAALLPAALTSGAYLECRLAAAAEQVDLIVRVDAEGGAVLAGRNPAISLPEPLAAHPVWARLAGTCAEWTGRHPSPLRGIDHLWLEFDLAPVPDPRGAPVPVPSVFVAPDPASAGRLSTDGWMEYLGALLERLVPEGVPAATAGALRTVFARRPRGALIPYLGFMLARPSGVVRVYFRKVPEPALAPWLRETGWPGSADRLATALAGLGDPRPVLSMVHLDVGEGLLPRVGIEFALKRRSQLRGRVTEAEFLHRLVESGLCAAGKHEGLLAWPGYTRRTLPHQLWPSLVVRRVNCVKLLYDEERGAEAKGYLLTYHLPAPPVESRLHPPREAPVDAADARWASGL